MIENSYPDLYMAYQLKEDIRLILHMKDHKLAEYELDSWIKKAKACGLTPMSKLADKIERHRTIVNVKINLTFTIIILLILPCTSVPCGHSVHIGTGERKNIFFVHYI